LHHYQACGFAISADLPLPLAEAERPQGVPLAITTGVVDAEGGDRVGPYAAAGSDWIAFEVPRLVRFHVTRSRIGWQSLPGADHASIASFILNSALPCAAMLAGIPPLRATAIDLGESALLLTGPPASGKSAVAAELVRRGHLLLSDGFALIGSDGRAMPGVTTLVLPHDTLATLGLDPLGLQPTRPGHARYHWPQAGSARSRPISAVYQLIVHTRPALRLADIRGAERLAMLRANAFRQGEYQRFGLNQAMLQLASALSAQARFRRIWRPVKDLPVTALADAILSDMAQAEAAA
jgi:hypothetical protein